MTMRRRSRDRRTVSTPESSPPPRPTSFATRLVAVLLRLPRLMLEAALALIIVFEEWGWRPLADLLGRLGRLKPFAALERFIAGLPPYAALVVFALPSLLLFPLKLLALWLIAKGQAIAAGTLFIGAKVVGTALVARIFQLTQPALMKLGWFARLYGIVMPWKEALVAWVRTTWAWRYGRIVKARMKTWGKKVWLAWKPRAMAIVAGVRGVLARIRSGL